MRENLKIKHTAIKKDITILSVRIDNILIYQS